MIFDPQKDAALLPPGMGSAVQAVESEEFIFRQPSASDGPAITGLIAACPPLDRNSRYCNLVQCEHFADSCIVAQRGRSIIGWISGHRPPSEPQSLFIWQVAVATEARGQRLASRMLEALVARPSVRDIDYLTTTITQDNAPSWSLFRGMARVWNTQFESQALFERDSHFAGMHATEFQARIGPLDFQTSS